MSLSPTHELIRAYLSEPTFKHVSKSHVHAPILKVFKKDEIIFREGEEAKAVFLLWKGKVIIAKKKENSQGPNFYILDTLEPGELLGLVGVLSNISYTTSAVAAAKVQAFEVLKEEFIQFLKVHPSCQLSIAERLSKKIMHYESILSKGA